MKHYHNNEFYSKDEAYNHLAKQICATAVEDYRKALNQNRMRNIKEIERFFLSDWFMLLSDGMEGQMLIEIIKEQENYNDQTHSRRI